MQLVNHVILNFIAPFVGLVIRGILGEFYLGFASSAMAFSGRLGFTNGWVHDFLLRLLM